MADRSTRTDGFPTRDSQWNAARRTSGAEPVPLIGSKPGARRRSRLTTVHRFSKYVILRSSDRFDFYGSAPSVKCVSFVRDEHIVNCAEKCSLASASLMDSKKRRALPIQAAIARILYEDWDPIGLAGVASSDEYDSYAGGVYRLVASGATPEQIAEHLVRIERAAMGYDQATIRDLLPIARKLQAVDLRLDTEGNGKR